MLIIDNFLTDPQAVASIDNSPFWEDKSFYWRKFDYKGWETYSKSKSSVGSYIVDRLLQEDQLVSTFPFYSAAGYEYWPTVLMPGMDLDTSESGTKYSLAVHSDYDVVKAMETGEMSFPLFGAILYFGNSQVEGGLLRVWENETTYREVEPIHNRLVVFYSHMPHGVTEVTKGIRKSIAINFWKDKIMVEDGEIE